MEINLLTFSFLDFLVRRPDRSEESLDEESSSPSLLLLLSESESDVSATALLRFDFFFFDLARKRQRRGKRLKIGRFRRAPV